MRRLIALAFALALALGACGGKKTPTPAKPDAAAAAKPDAAAAAKPDAVAAKPAVPSPVAALRRAGQAPLSDAVAITAALASADKLVAYAKEAPEAADAPEARALAARLRLAAATAAESGWHAHARQALAEAEALAKEGVEIEGYRPADMVIAAKARLASDPSVKDVTVDLDRAKLVAAKATVEGAVVRSTWLQALATTLEALPTVAPEEQLAVLAAGAGRVLCAGCADNEGVGLAAYAEQAKPTVGLVEPALRLPANAAIIAAMGRALELIAAPIGDHPLAPTLEAHRDRASEAVADPFLLPEIVALAQLPAAGERAADATAPAPVGDLGDTGLDVSSRVLDTWIVGPDGVRGGLRPVIAPKDGKVGSASKASGVALDEAPIMTLAALAEAEVDKERGGAVAALVEAAEKVRIAADDVAAQQGDERVASLIVDALAPADAVARTLASLEAGGYTAFRFVKTGAKAPGRALPLVVRDAPEDLPEAAAAGFERPVIVDVGAERVDVWAPHKATAAAAPQGDGDAEPPAGVDTGYRGKTLVRLRVDIPEAARGEGLGAKTLGKIGAAMAFWRKRTGAGPLVHVVGSEGALAADVLKIARAFQEAPGDDLAHVDQIWPGARCDDDPKTPCASGVAVAFSDAHVPSSRGITTSPRQAKAPPKPKGPPSSPEFCDKRDIKAKMNRLKGRVRAECYEFYLRQSPELAGAVPVMFTIGMNGKVIGTPKIQGATLKHPKVHKCIQRKIRGVTFKPPQGGNCVVRWPYRFQAR